MCILFLHTECHPGQGKYKLILAANRDEYYTRLSKELHCWGCHPDIVGGTDEEPGKEGGTWLAMSKMGKIGALLNMPPKLNTVKSHKQGRGFLVTNYLKSNLNGTEYGNQLRRQNAAKIYHSFNLLTVDVHGRDKENGPTISYFSNYSPKLHKSAETYSDETHYNQLIQNSKLNPVTDDNAYGFNGDIDSKLNSNSTVSKSMENEHFQIILGNDKNHSFGNCPYTAPLLKVKDGQVKFNKLVKTFDQKEEGRLVEGLLNILKSSDKHYPDPRLQTLATARSQEFAEGISSRFVHIPWKNYGSRTHTVILVDDSNHVKYMEWTMTEPVLDPLNCEWIKTKIEFEIEDE